MLTHEIYLHEFAPRLSFPGKSKRTAVAVSSYPRPRLHRVEGRRSGYEY